jgi:hypothetical protein
MNLEDKIKEYLYKALHARYDKKSGDYIRWTNEKEIEHKIAKDIVEIVRTEYSDHAINKLKKENAKLQKKIDRLEKNEIIYHERLKDK